MIFIARLFICFNIVLSIFLLFNSNIYLSIHLPLNFISWNPLCFHQILTDGGGSAGGRDGTGFEPWRKGMGVAKPGKGDRREVSKISNSFFYNLYIFSRVEIYSWRLFINLISCYILFRVIRNTTMKGFIISTNLKEENICCAIAFKF